MYWHGAKKILGLAISQLKSWRKYRECLFRYILGGFEMRENNIVIGNEENIVFYEDKDGNTKIEVLLKMKMYG